MEYKKCESCGAKRPWTCPKCFQDEYDCECFKDLKDTTGFGFV